jgi:sec-independent protein translocase protein TatB
MLDIGWTELLLIAVVAIVVIGPKDLPDALRSLGRMMTKIRRMAGEFQGQFNAALREADLEEVKKDFDSIRQSTSVLKGGFNPLDIARNEIKGAITGPGAVTGAEALEPATPPPAAIAPIIDPALTSSATAAETPMAPAPAAETPSPPETEHVPSAFATLPSLRK